MKLNSRQSGLTLTETTVVVASAAMLAVFALPAVRAFMNSFEVQGGAKAMISAGLASARAIAAREQRYAGVRFQKIYSDSGDPLKVAQYMIFIVYDFDKIGLKNGFRAIEGIEPIKLPDSVGVMDLMVRIDHGTGSSAAEEPNDRTIDADSLIDDPEELRDTTAFSILFSPSGKLIIHDVRTRNRDGKFKPSDPDESMDDIFNSSENIRDYSTGMFVQDDYADLGLGAEPSRNSFIIYNRTLFAKINENNRWSDYLKDLEFIYINPYTGTIIDR